jgi:hypothetical protein
MCLYDADLIVNLEENMQENPLAPETLQGMIDKNFLTRKGKALAVQTFLGANG